MSFNILRNIAIGVGVFDSPYLANNQEIVRVRCMSFAYTLSPLNPTARGAKHQAMAINAQNADGRSISAQVPFEKRKLTVYALTVAKSGPKRAKSQGDPSQPPGLGFGPANIGATNTTMVNIAEAMQRDALDRPVMDQTGSQEGSI